MRRLSGYPNGVFDWYMAGNCPHLNIAMVCFFHGRHGPFDTLGQFMHVTLADSDGGMPHQLLDHVGAGAGLPQPGSETVPEGMKTQALELQLATCPLHLVLERRLRDREEGLGVTVHRDLLEDPPSTHCQRKIPVAVVALQRILESSNLHVAQRSTRRRREANPLLAQCKELLQA